MGKVGSIERRVKRSNGILPFILGTLFGLILCLGLLVGAGFFIYYNVSIDWVNNTFNANIDLDNKEIEKKTLNDVVSIAMSLANNIDEYTLNDLKNDFGIDLVSELENMTGLDIYDLSDVAIMDIPNALQDKISNISASELENMGILNMSSMDVIMNKTNTYYYNSEDETVYRENTFSSKVAEVEESEGKKYINDYEITISSDNTVVVPFKYVPLSIALEDFTSNMGENITVGELSSEFNVQLPSYIVLGNETKTINEIENIINDLKVGDILGVKYHESGDLYYVDTNENNIFDAEESEVSSLINVIKDTPVSSLAARISSITVGDLFPDEVDSETGILSLIDADTTIENIPSAIEYEFKDITIGELIDAEIVAKPDNYEANKDKYVTGTDIKLKNMKVSALIELVINKIPLSDTSA